MSSELVGLLGRLRRSHFLRLSFFSSLLRAASLGLTILTSIILARSLGPAGLGFYSFALAVVALVGLPIHMGLPTLIIRETARGESVADWSTVRGLWNWAGNRILAVSLLMFGLIIPALYIWGDRIIEDAALPTIWISLLLVPLIAVAQLRGAAARGLHRTILGVIPDAIIRPAILLVLLLAVSAWHVRVGPEIAMGLHVLAATIAMVFGAAALVRIAPSELRHAKANLASRSSWNKALTPFALLAGSQVLMQNANILLLGIWESPENVGYFKIAVSAANLSAIGLTAIDMIVAPTFAKLHSEGRLDALQREASKAAALAFGIALPIAALFCLAGEFILSFLYGTEFQPSYAPLMVLLLGQLVNAFCGSCGHLLNMTGHEAISLKLLLPAMVLNVVLNVILIPVAGILGAAMATAISLAGLNLTIVFAINRKLGVCTTPLGLIPPNGEQLTFHN